MNRRLATILRKLPYRARRPLYRRIGRDHLTGVVLAKGINLLRMGSEYGGWIIHPDILDCHSVAYCAGCGEDITFDLSLIDRIGCPVYAFDPTPRAIEHVSSVASSNNQYCFEPVGLWDSDTTLRFYIPANPDHVSHSAVNLQGTDEYIEVPVVRLSHIMQRLGHDRIDLLKLDIEGAEYKVIDSILEDKIDVGMLCVEYDEWYNPLDDNWARRISESVCNLIDSGYAMVAVDGDANYTFIHKSRL